MAEPLPISTEYRRLEMVKLSVRVSKLYNRTVRREGVRWQSLRASLSPVIMINHDNLLSSFPVVLVWSSQNRQKHSEI